MKSNATIEKLLKQIAKFTLRDSGTPLFAGYALHRLARPEGWKSEVYIGQAASYDLDLTEIIAAGFANLGVSREEIAGKHILLKPNLVETASIKTECINTHPRIMRATILALQNLGAARVTIAEGAGHRRDSMILLEQSGLIDVMRETGARFVDLNYADVVETPNLGGATRLASFMLPKILKEVDWVISMAKLKTHHWAGVTLAMKNLYGVVPGVYYGWPKNVLHHVGLQKSIYDVAASVGAHFAIIDGIVGMEGDGPILGDPKQAGVVVMGRNLPAVDATSTRIMNIDPHVINYLAACPYFLGPIDEQEITQKGVPIDTVRTEFQLLDHIHAHRGLLKRRQTKTKAGRKETYGMMTY